MLTHKNMRHHLSFVILTGYLTLFLIQQRTVDAKTVGAVGIGFRHFPLKSSVRLTHSNTAINSFGRIKRLASKGRTVSNKNISATACQNLNFYPHPNKCNSYYSCDTATSTISWIDCAEGNYYNGDEKKCAEGTCRYESFPGEGQWDNGFMNHPSCNMYYTTQARNFKMILAAHKCPAGQHFNNETNQCVAGDCAAKPPPTDLPKTAPGGFVQKNCRSYNTAPHPTKCDAYTKCDKGTNKVSYVECGKNSHFDRKVKACAEGTCRYEAFPGECFGEAGNYAHPVCNKYKECIERGHVYIIIERTCEAGQHYDGASKTCVAGDCDKTAIATTTKPEGAVTAAPQMSDEDCDPSNCTIVGECNNYKYCKGTKDINLPPNKQTGKLVEAKCDSGLWFNPDSPSVSSQDDGNGGTAAVCTKWMDIKEEIRDDYLSKCSCNYFPSGECSTQFIFQEEEPAGSRMFVNRTKTCPTELIWNQETKTCSLPCNVKNAGGEPCGTCPEEQEPSVVTPPTTRPTTRPTTKPTHPTTKPSTFSPKRRP